MTALGVDYRRLWASSAVANLGDGVRLTALPLLAAAITRDPMAIAGLTVAADLPWLLVSLFAGALVDRTDRRVLMIRVQVVRTVIAAVLAATVLAGSVQIIVLYALVLVLGVCEVLFDVAAPTMLPRIVGKDHLPRGNARLSAAELTGNEFVGPPLGGFLFRLGHAVPFVLDAVSFAVSAVALTRIRGPFRPDHPEGATPKGILADVGEGVRWLWHQPLFRGMTVIVAFMNLARAMTLAIFVLYALELLKLNEIGFGVLTSAVAVGAVVATFIIDRMGWRIAGPVMLLAVLGHGLSTAAMGLTSNPWLAGLFSAAFGFATMTWSLLSSSVRQAFVPDRLLGRVSSVHRFVSWGSLPLGGLLGGVLAAQFGLRAPFLIGGAAVVLVAIVTSRLLLRVSTLFKDGANAQHPHD